MTGMVTVVILGASGYIAQRLINELKRHGHRTVAVARDTGRIPFYERTGAEILTAAELPTLKADAPVLINLSYPQNVPTLELQSESRKQIGSWVEMAEAMGATRLIHISSQAVFGYVWKEAPPLGRAPRRFDDTYVELKLQAEHLLYKRWNETRKFELAIVRLGNVLGGGSVPYAVTLAQRIMEGRPAAARNGEGMLNGTHVDNIAAYLRALVELAKLPGDPGVFHHLVEFGERRWKDLVQPMADTIGVRPVYLAGIPGEPSTFTMKKLRPHISTLARRLGGVIRSVPGLPATLERIKPKESFHGWSGSDPNRGWFLVTGSEFAFPSSVIPGWTPPLSWDAAVAEMTGWLGGAGYVLEAQRDRTVA